MRKFYLSLLIWLCLASTVFAQVQYKETVLLIGHSLVEPTFLGLINYPPPGYKIIYMGRPASNLHTWWDNDDLPDVNPSYTGGQTAGRWESVIGENPATKIIIMLLFNDVFCGTIDDSECNYATPDAFVTFFMQYLDDIIIGTHGYAPEDIIVVSEPPIDSDDLNYLGVSYGVTIVKAGGSIGDGTSYSARTGGNTLNINEQLNYTRNKVRPLCLARGIKFIDIFQLVVDKYGTKFDVLTHMYMVDGLHPDVACAATSNPVCWPYWYYYDIVYEPLMEALK